MERSDQYDVSTDEKGFDPDKVPWWTSSRLALAVLGFFGFLNVYALRVNMSVAVVCMVNHTAISMKEMTTNSSGNLSTTIVASSSSSHCGLISTGSENKTDSDADMDGEFVWDKKVQGIILGSFFWGYLFTQIPGGWLATKIGGKRVYGYCMLGATIATFLTPIGAQTHYIFLIALRVIVGFTSGVCYPSMHALWGNWAPPLERSKLVSFTYAGAQVGNVITFPLAGVLCKYGFAGGWPSIFYVLGIISSIWFVLWMIFVSDSPSEHKRISKEEKAYILYTLRDSAKREDNKSLSVPWCKMFFSMPVMAILVANITTDWGLYTLLTSIPTYMNEVLKLNIYANGLYSALPYIAFWLIINITGWLADFIASRGNFSIALTRKSFTVFGMLVPAVLLIGLGYVDCSQPGIAITLLVLGVSLSGAQYSGWVVNHMDVAPAFAGILFGISNSIAGVTGILSPVVAGILTEDKTREQWQKVFYVAAAFYVFGAIFYAIFASGTVQPWARKEIEEALDAEVELLQVNKTNGKVNHEENGDATKVTDPMV
ncbi:sialin-like [Mya arenaria]|uniref:sialin-like n=1 Tax=Mya arenaria TaxID=6604 RepID=UPI0022E2E7C6|nr:sialin-like [Mya arenaria]